MAVTWEKSMLLDCDEFVHAIVESIKDDKNATFKTPFYCSILFHGSTDKTPKETNYQ